MLEKLVNQSQIFVNLFRHNKQKLGFLKILNFFFWKTKINFTHT